MTKDKSTETPQEREARLAKFHAMTDAENEANIASDPDAQGPTDLAFLLQGRVVHRGGKIIVPVEMDEKTMRFFDEHHLTLAGVLKAFVAAQQDGRHD